MHSIAKTYHGSIYGCDRQHPALRCRWENVHAYDDRLCPHRQFVLGNHAKLTRQNNGNFEAPIIAVKKHKKIVNKTKHFYDSHSVEAASQETVMIRRSHLLMLMAVIVSGPFLLGCLIYRIRGLDDEGIVFEFVEPSASTNAYNDRVGRAVEPHARWVEHGHRWQSPQRGLRVFSAHYRHELRSFSEPIIRVLALATAEFLDSCLVRARIVYRDYPNSIPTGRVTCRQLSRSSEGAERNTSQRLHDAILEVATGQPDDRVPVALSIETSQDHRSVVWIPVKASFVDPLRESDSIAVCIHVDSGNVERASDLASWYRSRGSGQVTAYGVAKRSAASKAPSFSGEFVPLYDSETLYGVSDVTATSLMLRDCALRSSATSKCVALLGADERLVADSRGSRTNAACVIRSYCGYAKAREWRSWNVAMAALRAKDSSPSAALLRETNSRCAMRRRGHFSAASTERRGNLSCLAWTTAC
ncbi:hypothetical protein HPB51_002173 [Rhipicephalus microplus]|uniref:Uncharacterized protein n=1 Tax=Rhipicephalus microplus TaxID=6941 RepID=A0A9J6EKF0_RHIMP|nr:hypothetical protein HPB51_002173 [Rhipicephalus microplus]